MTDAPETPIRVVVADDHAVVREGIRRVLEREADLQVVGEARSGPEVLRVAAECDPDVLLLDLGLPELGGLDILRRLRAEDDGPRVLVLSMHDGAEYVLEAVRNGVHGYLVKDEAEPGLLRQAIRTIAAGDSFFSPSAAKVLAGEIRPAGTDDDPLSVLTDREREVLSLVARGKTSREAGELLGISHRTVETHRENLMRKLDTHSVAGLTRLAIEAGLVGAARAANPRHLPG